MKKPSSKNAAAKKTAHSDPTEWKANGTERKAKAPERKANPPAPKSSARKSDAEKKVTPNLRDPAFENAKATPSAFSAFGLLKRLWKFRNEPASAIAQAILEIVARIPQSKEHARATSTNRERSDHGGASGGKVTAADAREARIDELIRDASWKCAGVAGGLALPAGPLGILTILPSLYSIWKLQAQLVSDIAAIHGKSDELVRESMLYCLFRHGAASAIGETVVQAGGRLVVRELSFEGLTVVAERLGIALSEATLKRFAGRLVPIAGALAVGAFAKEDTRRVGETARGFFSETAKGSKKTAQPS